MSNRLKLIHLFSGVGAPEMALKRLGIPLEIVGFSEIDKYAIQSYKAIHGDIPNLGDIKHIERLPKCNLLFYGFCCQDISIAGNQKGLLDENGNQTRSGLLFDVLRLLKVAKQNNELPEIAIAENVKNLVSKKFKPDFEKLLQVLDSLGYNSYYSVLNAKDYGVPQNRERVFVVSIRKDIDKRGYNFPKEMQLLKRLKDVLETEVDEKYYLSDKAIEGFLKHNENHLAKGTGSLWKPRDLDGYVPCLRANGALCPTDNTIQESVFLKNKGTEFEKPTDVACTLLARDYKGLSNYRGNGVIEYSIAASRGRNPENPSDRTVGAPTEQRLEINSRGLANTLTTLSGKEKVITNFRIRRLTPLECWRLMDFSDEDFNKAKASGLSNTQLYKIAGNSIVVNVLYHIFRKLFIDFNEVKSSE